MEPLESAREQLKKLEDKVATLKQRKAKIKGRIDAAARREDARAKILIGTFFAGNVVEDTSLAGKILDSLPEKDQAVLRGWIEHKATEKKEANKESTKEKTKKNSTDTLL